VILDGNRLASSSASGVLVIGDPHVGLRRPGRRTDPDWPSPILAKLARCAEIANERDLAPVILGDLFDRPVERDENLKVQLIRILKSFDRRPLVNVGNHDIAHTRLSDGDTLALLGLCDVVDVVATSGPVTTLDVAGRRLGIGMTPYGQDIPRSVRDAFAGAHEVAWFTHHDIAFESAYPGAAPPHAVEGCGLVVNGHMHRTQKPVLAGATRWHNPGNIARLSVDLKDHVPRAWVLGPDGGLVPEALPYAGGVFDLTGRLVEAASGAVTAEAVESAFVSLLRAEDASELGRSGDGSIIREIVEARLEAQESPDAVRAIVRSLLAEAVERRNGG
jgi:hypothetical protein